jgi:hypothetical protein
MASVDPRSHAAGMVKYYERLCEKQGSYYEESLRLAREWLRLVESVDPSPAEALDLLQALEKGENSGSGWTDMELGVAHWARTRGLLR